MAFGALLWNGTNETSKSVSRRVRLRGSASAKMWSCGCAREFYGRDQDAFPLWMCQKQLIGIRRQNKTSKTNKTNKKAFNKLNFKQDFLRTPWFGWHPDIGTRSSRKWAVLCTISTLSRETQLRQLKNWRVTMQLNSGEIQQEFGPKFLFSSSWK